jgi:predicted RNA-binding Zn ribbon-like protein
MTMQVHATIHDPPGTAPGPPLPFLFVGDALALDLVNTEIVVRRNAIDLLTGPGAYAAWWHAAASHHPDMVARLPAGASEANPELLPNVITLRGALREIFGAVANGAMIPADALAILNRVLEGVDDAIELSVTGEPRPLLVPRAPAADGPLAAVARSAFALLTEGESSRLHRCANERCVLYFYDTTKSATRRWCSTACMNRARSSRRYRERRQAADQSLSSASGPP